MNRKYWMFYFASLAVLLGISVYPIYMGWITLSSNLKNGFVTAADYPKYIIPYTPLCIAAIIAVALMPLWFKICKKYTLPVSSVIGACTFFAFEFGLEKIHILDGYEQLPLQSWQYSLCVATPQVLASIGEPIYAKNNPAFKVHFYLIALVILFAVLQTVYGFSKMLRENNFTKRKPLTAQLISLVIFIGLCIFACLTAFYRKGTIQLSSLSSFLMGLFFIAFGVTVGVYFGCIFYGRKRALSILLPSIFAMITTAVMYAGELILMDGELFKYGRGAFFEPIGCVPFAAVDLAVILLSGVITCAVLQFLRPKERRANK